MSPSAYGYSVELSVANWVSQFYMSVTLTYDGEIYKTEENKKTGTHEEFGKCASTF
jgi:hypothetical protein